MIITMTAVLRPEVLNKTLSSFESKLFGSFKDHTLIVNIDPVGNAKLREVLNVMFSFFKKENVLFNSSEEPHFGKAAKWCWDQITSDMGYVFHLEDDWQLMFDTELSALIRILDENPRAASVKLLIQKPKYNNNPWRDIPNKFFITNNKLSLNPCLCRAEYLNKLSKLMDQNKNPELQVVHAKSITPLGRYTNRWDYLTYNHKNNPIVKNIGQSWKIKNNIKRGKSNFTTWMEAN